MIEKMTKYSWIVPSSGNSGFLETLRKSGVVDIRRSSKPVDEKSEKLFSEIESLRARIAELRKGSDATSENLRQKVRSLDDELAATTPWGDFDKEKFAELGLEIRFYVVPDKKYMSSWEDDFAIQVIDKSGGLTYFVLIGPGSLPIKSTPAPERKTSEISADLEMARQELEAYSKKLSDEAAEIPVLEAGINSLSSDLSLYLAGRTATDAADSTLCIYEGFAPSSCDIELKNLFDSMELIWLSEDATVEDNPPIKLKNNAFSRQFEVLTRMYGMPAYNEFDPSIFLSIFFLLFFAICMGDTGYGLLLILIGLFLKGKKGGLADMWTLIVTLGAGTVVVGFLMGGFFGIDLTQQEWIPQNVRNLMITGDIEVAGISYSKQMVLSLLIGVVHICLAMTLKAVWSVRKDGLKNSLSAIGWATLIVGSVIGFSIGLTGLISESAMKWTLISVAGLSALGIFIFNQWGRNPLVNVGSGLWDTYSMASGLMGDVLSYIRLYALGLSGSMLGATFNQVAEMVKGPDATWQWLPYIIILVFGHSLNIALSGLGAFVHPLRLNFVEFFKNSGYEGRGKEYEPLK